MSNPQKGYQLFASFKNKFYQEEAEPSPAPDSGSFELDAEMTHLIQKINKQSKKSSATRLKALQQTSELLAAKDPSYFDSFLKFFTIVFEKILTCEEDTKVLLELHKCMATLLIKGEASVKKQFAQIFHYLYFASFEPNKELSEIARANLALILKADDKVARSVYLFRDKFFTFANGIVANKAEFLNNMSIYDDKEVNEIIYRKLVSMVWWATADMLDKSKHLKPEERTALFERIAKMAFESEHPFSLASFNGANDDYITKTAILYFWSLALESGLTIDKPVLKKICQAILLNNLDDPNTSFQSILWRNGFILRLFELAKGFNITPESMLKRFQNVVDNHCWGVGSPYYVSLPESIRVLTKDEPQAKGEQLVKRLLFGHFKSVTKDDLKFEVGQHFKIGFDLIRSFINQYASAEAQKTDEKNKKNAKFEGLAPEVAAAEIFEPLNNLYFTQNNHLQKNLNAISINLIKFYPVELGPFLSSLDPTEDGAEQKFAQLVRDQFDSLSKKVFSSSLNDQKLVVNLAICLKLLVFHLDADTSPKNPLVGQILADAFGHFSAAFQRIISNISDANLKMSLESLENLMLFVREIGEKSLSFFQKKVVAVVPEFAQNFTEFSKFLADSFTQLVIEQKINNKILSPEAADSFSEFYSDFLKFFIFSIDSSALLKSLENFSKKNIVEIVSKGQWKKVLGVISDPETLKTTKQVLAGASEDWSGALAKISKIKIAKNQEYRAAFIENDNFWALYSQMAEGLLKNNILAYSAPLLQYIDSNRGRSELILANAINEHFQAKKTFDFATNELFKLSFTFEVLKEMSEPFQKQVIESILTLLERLDTVRTDTLREKLPDLLGYVDPKVLTAFFLHFWRKILDNDHSSAELASLFKLVAKIVSKNLQKPEKERIESALKTNLTDYFEKYVEQSHSTNDSFRVVHKQIPQLNFQQAVEATLSLHLQHTDEQQNDAFLFNLIAQPSLLHNFSAKKQKQFWNQIVHGFVLGFLMRIYGSDFDKFEALFYRLAEHSFKNFALAVFLKRVLRQILNDDSNDEKTQAALVVGLLAFFKKRVADAPADPSALFVYKSTLSIIDVKTYLSGESFLAQLRESELTLEKSMLYLQVLKSKTLKLVPEEADKLRVAGAPEDLTILGKVLHVQIEFLKSQLSHPTLRPFALALLLDYLDFALENHEEQVVATNTELLENELKSILKSAEANFAQPFSQNCFHAFLVLLRKLIAVLEMFSDSFRQEVFRKISLYSFRISVGIKAREFLGTEFWTIPPEDFFGEIAETISRFAIRDDTQLKVDEVMELLEIDINSIKKSAFFLIQQFKDPFGVTWDELSSIPEENNTSTVLMFKFPPKLADLVADKSADDNFTYFLKWAYLLQLCGDQSEQSKLNFAVVSRLFTDERSLYGHLMRRIFSHFYEKNLNVREIEEEIESLDFATPEKQWGEVATDEVKQSFAIHLLFTLTYLFPKNLRSWLETEKSLSAIALTILKARINQAIYLKELDKIELTQHEWKSDDFDVFYNKNTKEIFAVYLKDDSRFEVVLSVPGNYPVKPISIKISGTAKIDEVREKKWKLVITRALTGQNNNIIDALVLWKKTMDAEFDGIDPCPICYYIIHPTSKKRPQMSCKTCKKLLHSDCVRQWFASAHKSECPLCKSQFM